MDFGPLLARIGDARVVMLGEASHGTREYYRLREVLTRRLIAEHGFSFVAVEGDWPDCDRVHRAVTRDGDTNEALHQFARWPTWMWANAEVAEFCGWLRQYNNQLKPDQRVGFHGLDVYSLWESLNVVVRYVTENEPDNLDAVWQAYRCFEPYFHDPQEYALATRFVSESCESDVIRLLVQARAARITFDVWQNVNVVVDAERYYRAMIAGGPQSWNIRDRHMMDTIDRLMRHYGDGSKAVVWAHNTHVGDAEATDMADEGMVNIGQLARRRYGRHQVVLVGFGCFEGSVIAAPRWGDPWRRMTVPPARDGSLERLLYQTLAPQELVVFPQEPQESWHTDWLPHRAIGVVYRPDAERWSNYVPTRLSARYDAFIWCDHTTALRPMHAAPTRGELETFPSGV